MTRRGRWAAWALGLPVLWTLADLYLRIDLPGASHLAHLAVAGPLGLVERLGAAGLLLAAAAAVALAWGGWASAAGLGLARRWRRAAAVLLAPAAALLGVVALLVERAPAAGLLAAALVARRPPERPAGSRATHGAEVVAALAAAAFAATVFRAWDGRPGPVEWLGELLRAGQLPGGLALGLAAVALAGGVRGWRAALIAGAVAAAVRLPLGSSSAWLPEVAVAAGAAALAASLPRRADALGRAAPWLLAAALLLSHTLFGRMLRCPEETPWLTRVATPSEVFRVALGPDTHLLSLRFEPSLARWSAAEGLRPVDPGPFVSNGAWAGVPEDVVYAPGLGAFLAGAHPDHLRPEWVPEQGSEQDVRSVLVQVPADGSRVEAVRADPEVCGVGSLLWSEPEQRLYAGCEQPAGLVRVDPVGGQVEQSPAPGLRDVQALALRGDRIETVSLWHSGRLVTLDRATLQGRGDVWIGGGNYDLAALQGRDRLFASGYYAGRVRVIDDGRPAGSIPTGFGTRALALHEDLDLLLASSVLEGHLAICSASTGERRARLGVGGNVLDIAVDEERGEAWFWSQCGLHRIDLAGLLRHLEESNQ